MALRTLSALTEHGLAQKYFLRHHIKCHFRAPNMHARYIERRGALFREVIHKNEEQLKKDRIDLPFDMIVAEAVFAGNTLLTINGSSPHNAVYGRVPRILPSIDGIYAPERTMATMPSTIAHTHKLREIAVAAMVEGSAQERLKAALHGKFTVANAILDLRVGDTVDFYRPPSTKDVSGWFGPATVVDVSLISHGVVSVRYCRGLYEVQLRDLRRHAVYWIFLITDRSRGLSLNAWSAMHRVVASLPGRGVHLVGHRLRGNAWPRTNRGPYAPFSRHACRFAPLLFDHCFAFSSVRCASCKAYFIPPPGLFFVDLAGMDSGALLARPGSR